MEKKKQRSCTTLKEKKILFQKDKNESSTNLSQVGNNFTSLHSSIVVFINQKWLNNHKDLQEIRPSSVNGMNIKSILPKKKMHWSIATIYLTLWTNGRTRSSSLYRILSMTFTNKWRSCKQKNSFIRGMKMIESSKVKMSKDSYRQFLKNLYI